MVLAWWMDDVMLSYMMYCPVRLSMPKYVPELHRRRSGPMPFSLDLALYLQVCPNGIKRVDAPDPRASCCAVLPSWPRTRMFRTLAAYVTSQVMIGCSTGTRAWICLSKLKTLARTEPFNNLTAFSAAPFVCGSYRTDPSSIADVTPGTSMLLTWFGPPTLAPARGCFR